MLTYKDHTLAAIVSDRHQAAAVFEKYHLDFCCKGKRTLQQACVYLLLFALVWPIKRHLKKTFIAIYILKIIFCSHALRK